MKTKSQVKLETINFFESLIEKTGTYYLSDYVEVYGEFDDEVISKKEHIKIVEKRDLLKKQCQEQGLDIHVISCEVASTHIN